MAAYLIAGVVCKFNVVVVSVVSVVSVVRMREQAGNMEEQGSEGTYRRESQRGNDP